MESGPFYCYFRNGDKARVFAVRGRRFCSDLDAVRADARKKMVQEARAKVHVFEALAPDFHPTPTIELRGLWPYEKMAEMPRWFELRKRCGIRFVEVVFHTPERIIELFEDAVLRRA